MNRVGINKNNVTMWRRTATTILNNDYLNSTYLNYLFIYGPQFIVYTLHIGSQLLSCVVQYRDAAAW